jgi:hypothetical protein
MPVTVRKEIRKRGLFGKIFKFLFYAFNVLMIVFLVSFWRAISGAIGPNGITPDQGIGTNLLGTVMIAVVWLLGDGVLGALVLATRGSKIVLESRDHAS